MCVSNEFFWIGGRIWVIDCNQTRTLERIAGRLLEGKTIRFDVKIEALPIGRPAGVVNNHIVVGPHLNREQSIPHGLSVGQLFKSHAHRDIDLRRRHHQRYRNTERAIQELAHRCVMTSRIRCDESRNRKPELGLALKGEAQVEEEQPRNCRRVQVILARPSPSSDEEEDKQVHDSHEYSSKRPNENVGPEGSNDLRNKLRRKSQITDRIHDYNGDLRTIIEESKARKVEDSSARSHLRPRVIDLRDSSKSTPSLSTNWGAYCWTWTLSPTRLIR
ncbi:hypothetical protein F2Q70_00013505 [Brassica cretica]|uniref:Uncharacterized protein n=1 Tax=Brassica cretica TaxID=69181 RepID=A0A8S9MAC9_BRACR|nr:hypothetical protein F2Q70_00013505 [Brassica cretica]